jgi:hypothetical protein
MYRKRAEKDTHDEGEGAVKHGCMKSGSAFPGKGTRVEVQAGFRRQLAHGRSPTWHEAQWNIVGTPMQAVPKNSDATTETVAFAVENSPWRIRPRILFVQICSDWNRFR